jgi:hypothetical protein
MCILSTCYHATECEWIGIVDMLFVQTLMLQSVTLLLRFDDEQVVFVCWCYLLVMSAHLLFHRNDAPRAYAGECWETRILAIFALSALGLFAYRSEWDSLVFYGSSFLFKFGDLKASARGVKYSSWAQGTAAFHVLTALSMHCQYTRLADRGL